MLTLSRLRRLAPVFLALPLSAQMAAMTPRDSARHVLDRLAWGPTPGQIDAVVKEGVRHWIDRQLSADQAKDPSLAPFEKQFEVLNVSSRELWSMYQDQQTKQAKIQAMTDTVARQKAMADQRMETLTGRKGVAALNTELTALTVLRSVEADRQLADVLTDFWTNHFNVYINKGAVRAYLPGYIETTIRPHVLESFEELLIATAKSPAMLFYLDNVQSVATGTGMLTQEQARQQAIQIARRRPGLLVGRGISVDSLMRAQNQQRRPQGLNENYARELMELHTLGVDGGYQQADVIAVARILTRAGIDRQNGGFDFRVQAHDRDDKIVMGTLFKSDGESEGTALLKMLAAHPSTMHHISAKLCARFVADVAPDGCIDDAVRAWQKSHGNIREVMRAIIYSPDFWSPANVQSKVKTPLGFVVSAIRAMGGTTDATPRASQQVGRLGQPLFQMQTPNGYPETQADWVNSGALLARMNFAVSLAAGRAPGISVNLDRVVPLTSDNKALVETINNVVLGGLMSANTRATILREIADQRTPQEARALAIGLAIGGPEFQRR